MFFHSYYKTEVSFSSFLCWREVKRERLGDLMDWLRESNCFRAELIVEVLLCMSFYLRCYLRLVLVEVFAGSNLEL